MRCMTNQWREKGIAKQAGFRRWGDAQEFGQAGNLNNEKESKVMFDQVEKFPYLCPAH
jgi:hypothetical protein